ncbi:MAG TPA: MFS transporter [Jatrophihabitans sp.]|nr:MFS transporter [Jatrophihabitans sp.]
MTATLAAPARPPLLRVPDFRRLWIGETTSALGSSVTSVALPLVALTTLHAGVFPVSLLSAAAWLPWLLIGLPAGAWVDRLPRRPVMMACDAASMALFASVPVAAALDALTMTQLLAVALASGTAKVFFSTAYRAYQPSLLPGERLVEANSRLQAAESAAQVGGPGLGGVLAQVFGATNGLLADAASFAVSLACLRRIGATESVPRRPRRSLRAEIAEGLRFVRHDRLLRLLMVFGGTANLVLTGFGAIQVAFLVRAVGLGPAAVGVLLAFGSIGGVIGASLAPALGRRFGTARALLLGKVGSAPAGLLIPLAGPGPRVALFAAGAFVLIGGIVAGNVISGGFMQAYCPPELMGRVTTTMQVVNFGAIPVGAVVGGVLADALGYRPALWLLLGGFVLSGAILLNSPLRRWRDLPIAASRPAPEAS